MGTSTNARGDMQAVIRATLLHPEARNDTPPSNSVACVPRCSTPSPWPEH